jgi:flagellar hook protein FlgE
MGISSALYSGASGLNTNSQAMSVIGNNLANTNTLGFKGSRTVFSDLLSSSINGSGGISQVGRGVNMSKVDQIFSQGTFESTESPLDVAIEGDGFFLLREPDSLTSYYSRAGAFRFDDEGFLVSPEGLRVQGQAYNADGSLAPGDPSDIQIVNEGLFGGDPTTELKLSTNLDASEPVIPVATFDITDDSTYNYSSSTQIYDSLGNPHLLTKYFNKTADNTWEWHWSTSLDDGTVVQGAGTTVLRFTTDGELEDPAAVGSNNPLPEGDTVTDVIAAADLDWANGTEPQDITITFDTTQFNSDFVVIGKDQNGFAAGELTDVSINEDGAVVASYANGEQTLISNLVLGKFKNPNGLELVGNNLYIETQESGVPRTGLPGPELGKVFTNSLEQSNVDMGAEFVRMITVQRGFQANSKIITTVDELLGELINLKR